MPKTTNTRKQRADDLLKTLERGPSIFNPKKSIVEEEFRERYDLWFRTWILRQFIDLVPELRKANARQLP